VLDVPSRLGLFVSGVLGERRREIGTRSGTGALSFWRRAVFALAWFLDVGCVENIRVQNPVAASLNSVVFSCPLSGMGLWAPLVAAPGR